MTNRNSTRRKQEKPEERRRPWLTLALGIAVIVAAVAFFAARSSPSGRSASATPAAQARADSAATVAGASPPPPTIAVPTPAIALPKDCPPDSAAQVDNIDKYGFCTPLGWGAYNNNNTQKLTLIMKPKPNSGPPVLEPTDFDRIQIIIALDTDPPQTEPAACKGAPNDAIDGLATHHCTQPLDPSSNPYQAVRAEYWTVDLANDRHFYMTALVGDGVTDEDNQMINTIVHALKPPASS
jgi:hypothetical protein